MTAATTFGWRVPDFPEAQQDNASNRARKFRDQIFNYLDIIHGHFDTAWAGYQLLPVAHRHGPVAGDARTLDACHRPEGHLLKDEVLPQRSQPGLSISCSGGENGRGAATALLRAPYPGRRGGLGRKGVRRGWVRFSARQGASRSARRNSVQIIREMWTEDTPTFSGKYYSINGAYCSPCPDPLPPLLIGRIRPQTHAENCREIR